MITRKQIEEFIAAHRLPGRFAELIREHYIPLADWILKLKLADETPLIGINGAQGTGKSTLAAFLRMALESAANWHVVVLSIDDFYLTKYERNRLANEVHPLLRTRGVPGTHDIERLSDCIDKLGNLNAGSNLRLPSFDKAKDDRADRSEWPMAVGPIDLIIIEGWCVGSRPQQAAQLVEPINSLEKTDDADGRWRAFVNENLKGDYARLFARLDALIFLQAPGFSAILSWRLQQEEKLAAAKPQDASGIMSSQQLGRFIQHYERITRNNLSVLPASADVVLEFNDAHDCTASHYKRESSLLSDQS
jgi:D-glycerate 3-kinase